MIRNLKPNIWQLRSDFLSDIRSFFLGEGYLEVDTPILNHTGTTDPFIDSMLVRRAGLRKSPQAREKGDGFLISSPEYNMKILLSELKRNIFEITHCFREGEEGDLHSEEFLMLEWYHVGATEFELMDECERLLGLLSEKSYSRRKASSFRRSDVADLLKARGVRSLRREDLERGVADLGLLGAGEQAEELRYDELFHTVFLNGIEGTLGREGPEFVHGYPPELAALSRVEAGRARRFEIYWRGTELANGYCELSDRREHDRRFAEHNALRKETGRPEMETDEQFLNSLSEMPFASGIAMGLDRLLMVLCDEETIAAVSPYP